MPEKTKIVHILPTTDARYGGPVVVANELARVSVECGMEAKVIPSINLNSNFDNFGFWPGLSGLNEQRFLIERATLVHLHGLWNIPTTTAAIMARHYETPYIITIHGMLDSWCLAQSAVKKTMWMKVFERQTIESAAALHFLNVGEHQEAIHFGFKSPSFILPNGTLLRMDGQPFDSCVLPHNGRIDGKIKILFLGRLHEKKGVELLLRAFSCLDASNKNLHLIVAGPAKPGYLAKLKSMSADFSIRCCDITWLGMVSGQLKESLLATADIFVLPSRQEGDSIAVKEAMSFGLPVIISKACRFPEVETNQAGIVVENEVADIVSALNWFCDHPDARKRFGENGRCLVEKEYRWDKIGRELLGVYRDIINGTKTSPRWVG